jgi:uncharacterized protein (DUF342 family)
MGQPPTQGAHARIRYFFDTHYKKAGIVAEDGTIDFRDRGEIPFVKSEALLAEKTPQIKGRPGRDVFGDPIPPDEVDDLMLRPGPGTRVSEDGIRLHATQDGQPCLDALGVVSVFRELIVRGDVDFETGHIDFAGNVLVQGIVKAGFRVSCVNLTAAEVHGGQIDASGDLNVSTGIVNASVRAMGSVRARFVNNARITAFDDVMVMREIMGSEISTGGAVINAAGQITASALAARKGMTLGQVGTERSLSSTLRTGVDDYLKGLLEAFDQKIKTLGEELETARAEKKALEVKNFAMHREVAEISFSQEKMQRSLEEIKGRSLELKGRKEAMIAQLKEIKKIEQTMAESDGIIKTIFHAQDSIMKAIENSDGRIHDLESRLNDVALEKEAVKELASLEKGQPEIRVTKRMLAGTRIFGPQSSLVIKNNLGACRIVEAASLDPETPQDRQLVILAAQ